METAGFFYILGMEFASQNGYKLILPHINLKSTDKKEQKVVFSKLDFYVE